MEGFEAIIGSVVPPRLVEAGLALGLLGICAVLAWRLLARPAGSVGTRSGTGRGGTALACLLAFGGPTVFTLAAAFQRQMVEAPAEPVNRPREVSVDGYVGADACRACHPGNHASWHASYHRTMTQVADATSVRGEFDDTRLELDGQIYRLGTADGQFWVEMNDPLQLAQGIRKRVKLPIVMTTGSHHMQAYWYATGVNRQLGMLPFVYVFEEQQWIPEHASFLIEPDIPRESTLGRWNAACLNCHATHPQPRIEPGTNFIDTQAGELGISCEACHGPGEAHVAANRDPLRRYRLHARGEPDPTIVNPARLDHRRSSEVCGHCHGIHLFHDQGDQSDWLAEGFRFRPGAELGPTRHTVRWGQQDEQPVAEALKIEPNYLDHRFWSDGMVRVSGREYNGLLESPCYQRGTMSCLSCHDMHPGPDDPRPLNAWADDQLQHQMVHGNQACTQCHQEYREPEALQAHTHHLPNSSGSECYNCHMPYTTYGIQKAIRSHTIDSPRIDRTLATGRPNGCNQCHLDRSLQWSASHLSQWYGQELPELDPDQRELAASVLAVLKGDAGQRALAAWNLGWPVAKEVSGDQWIAPLLAELLNDPYDVVRFIAHRSLRKLPGYEDFAFDFYGPPGARAAAAERARSQWKPSPPSAGGTAVLLNPQGRVQRDRLLRLLDQRDHRPVNLSE